MENRFRVVQFVDYISNNEVVLSLLHQNPNLSIQQIIGVAFPQELEQYDLIKIGKLFFVFNNSNIICQTASIHEATRVLLEYYLTKLINKVNWNEIKHLVPI